MIRRRLTSTKGSEGDSTQPRRRRISRSPSASIPQDERDPQLAELRANFRAEGARLRDAIRREIGGDVLPLVHESLGNMSSKARRRVLSFLDRRTNRSLEKIQKEMGIE
jgi:hypothetical protein